MLLLLLPLFFHLLPLWVGMHRRGGRRARVSDTRHRDEVHRAGWVGPALRVVLCPRLHVLIWVCCTRVVDEWWARHGLLLRLRLCVGMCLSLRELCLWLGLHLRLWLSLGLLLLLWYHALCLRLGLNGCLRLSMLQLSVMLRLALRLSRGLSLGNCLPRGGFCLLWWLLMIVRSPLVVRRRIWLHVCCLRLRLWGLLHWLRLSLYLKLRLRLRLRLRLWSSI